MWTSSLLKRNGRSVLKGHLLYSALSVALRILCTLFFCERLILSNIFPILFAQTNIQKNAQYYSILCISILLFILTHFLILNPITVGLLRFFMEQRQGTPPLSTIFSVFTTSSYWNVVKALFLRDIQVFFCSLLFLIPGILRHYQLRLVPWILAENPSLSSSKIFSFSKTLVSGDILALFFLDLSFLGWWFLSIVSCGFGFFLTLPYYYSTLAESYAAYRAKAFALSPSAHDFLLGFVRY